MGRTYVNIENLGKLSGYLSNIPDESESFSMRLYYGEYLAGEGLYEPDSRSVETVAKKENPDPRSCNSVACALGYGPAAGIPIPDWVESWPQYMEASFGVVCPSRLSNFIFSCSWDMYEPNAKQAAERMMYVISLVEKGFDVRNIKFDYTEPDHEDSWRRTYELLNSGVALNHADIVAKGKRVK